MNYYKYDKKKIQGILHFWGSPKHFLPERDQLQKSFKKSQKLQNRPNFKSLRYEKIDFHMIYH